MHEGRDLKYEVKRLNLTDDDFAAKCGVSRQTVSVWYGKSELTVKTKVLVIKALGLPENFFESKEMTGNGDKKEASDALTLRERDALWQIIEAQKDVIARLRDELNSKE